MNPSEKYSIKPDERVVVFRNGSIGNSLVAVPFIRAMKKQVPECFLSVIVDTIGEQLFRHCPYIDELIVYDKRGQHRPLTKTIRFTMSLAKKHFDKSIHLKRFFRNEAIAYCGGIPERFGFRSPGVKPFKLTATVPYREDKHVIDLYYDLLELIGLEGDGYELEMWLTNEDSEAANEFLSSAGIDDFIVFHTGWRATRGSGISPDGFIKMGREIINRFKLPIVIIGGPDEREVIKAINGGTGPGTHSAAGLPIRATARLIKNARLFLGNDGGPSHIANAVKTPGIIIYENERIMQRWRPRNDRYVTLIKDKNEDVLIEEIFDAVRVLL
jgi:ADP-heptose:LPS heptosyltransferase